MSLDTLVNRATSAFNEVRNEVESLMASGIGSAVMGALPSLVAVLDALEGHIHALHGLDQTVHSLTDAVGITTPQAPPTPAPAPAATPPGIGQPDAPPGTGPTPPTTPPPGVPTT